MFLFYAVIVNLLLLFSVLDVHYRSLFPNEITETFNETVNGTSKRLVLVLAEGLSAKDLFIITANEEGSFIRRIMKGEGSWGISYGIKSIYPQPGFLSIATGSDSASSSLPTHFKIFYPSKLDNIFNSTKEVFYIGKYGIRNFLSWNLTEKWHKFMSSAGDYAQINIETYQKLCQMFSNKTLYEQLNKAQVIFIIYLNAKYQCGEPQKEKCLQYPNMINQIDESLKNITETFARYYSDSSTSFVFTSLNGGPNKADKSFEYDTPFLAWGAGIESAANKSYSITLPPEWKAGNLSKFDLNKTDITPLISSLLGLPIPVHSKGMLHKQILFGEEEYKANALYHNVLQLKNIVDKESSDIVTGMFPAFITAPQVDFNVSEAVNQTSEFIGKHIYGKALDLSERLIEFYIRSLMFYQNYFKTLLVAVINFIYIGWGILMFFRIVSTACPKIKISASEKDAALEYSRSISEMWNKVTQERKFITLKYTFLGILCDLVLIMKICIICSFIYVQNWPLHFIIYFVLMDIIWWRIFKNIGLLLTVFKEFSVFINIFKWLGLTLIGTVLIIMGTLKIYSLRIVFGVVTLLPYATQSFSTAAVWLQSIWITSSIIIIGLLNVPVINYKNDLNLFYIGGTCWILSIIIYLYFDKKASIRNSAWTFVMLFCIIEACLIPKLGNHTVYVAHVIQSLILLAISLCLPVCSSQWGLRRLLHVCFSLSIPFILLCVRHESASLLFFATHIVIWFCIELHSAGLSIFETMSDEQKMIPFLHHHDVRRAFLFLVYCWSSFFIIGNITSMTTFEMRWATSFGRRIVGRGLYGIIIYKLLIPIMINLSAFILIYKQINGRLCATLETYLFLSNIIGCYFFNNVSSQNVTSQEEEQTLMRHFLAHFLPISILSLYPIVHILTNVVIPFNFEKIKQKVLETANNMRFGRFKHT